MGLRLRLRPHKQGSGLRVQGYHYLNPEPLNPEKNSNSFATKALKHKDYISTLFWHFLIKYNDFDNLIRPTNFITKQLNILSLCFRVLVAEFDNNDRSYKMKSSILNTLKRFPYISLFLTAAALLIHYFHPLRPHLLYTRTALSGGDLWRLVSCHWVHLNTDHLLWSALTFWVLGSFCEIMDRAKYVMTIGISAILIPMAIWIVMPHLAVYGGLSGLDCALYSLLIILFIQRDWHNRNWIWILIYTLMLVLLPAKIIYEMASGLTIFVNNIHTSMVPVPLSHLVGGVVGVAVGIYRASVDTPKIFTPLDLHISSPPCK